MKGCYGFELARKSQSLPLYIARHSLKNDHAVYGKEKTTKPPSSFMCFVMNAQRKSQETPMFSPLCLTYGSTISFLIPIFLASLLRVPKIYILSRHWSFNPKRTKYSSTISVRPSSLKVKHLYKGPKIE